MSLLKLAQLNLIHLLKLTTLDRSRLRATCRLLHKKTPDIDNKYRLCVNPYARNHERFLQEYFGLHFGIQVDEYTNRFDYILCFAAQDGNIELGEWCIDGYHKAIHFGLACVVACANVQLEFAKWCVSRGNVRNDILFRHCLSYACKSGDKATIEFCAQPLLHYRYSRPYERIVTECARLEIKRWAYSKCKRTPDFRMCLYNALRKRQYEVVEWILSIGIDYHTILHEDQISYELQNTSPEIQELLKVKRAKTE